MARNDSGVRYLDLLLRKSQVVRGVAKKDILSLKSQERRGRAWGKANGYEIRRVFRENLSAYKTGVQRPEFDAAVHSLLEGDSDCLWVYDSSRYSRKGAGDVLKILDAPGKRLYFDIDRLDTEVEADRSRIIGAAEQSREFSRVLSDKLRDTKAEQRDAGMWLSAAPYGLRVTKKRKLKHNKDWPVVERIHNEAAEGASVRKITQRLTWDGIPAPRGGDWKMSTVSKILRHPVYLGWQVTTIKGGPVLYLNAKGKKIRVFAKGVEGIPQATWDKHRRIAGGHELPSGFAENRHGRTGAPENHNPVSGTTHCYGCKGRATTYGASFGCKTFNTGGKCPSPAYGNRAAVLRVVLAQWRERLAEADPLDPTMLAVVEGWVALSQPEETHAEQEARGQIRLAEEAVNRLDRLFAVGAYGGRDGEATFAKLRRAAVEDVETARQEWEAVAKPLGDISILTDPQRCAELWEKSTPQYQGQLLRLAIEKVFIKKAAYSGQRLTLDRIVIEWKKPRGWEPAKAGKDTEAA